MNIDWKDKKTLLIIGILAILGYLYLLPLIMANLTIVLLAAGVLIYLKFRQNK